MDIKEIRCVSKKETLMICRNDALMKMCLAKIEVDYLLSLPEDQQNKDMISVRQSQVAENAKKVEIIDLLLDDEEELNRKKN